MRPADRVREGSELSSSLSPPFSAVSLPRSLWEKPKQGGEQQKGEEEYSFRHSGGGRLLRKHIFKYLSEGKKNAPVRSGRGTTISTRMCLRKRSGYRPPDPINAKIVSIRWAAGTGLAGRKAGGRGGLAAFGFVPGAPGSGGAFPRSAALRERSLLPPPFSFPLLVPFPSVPSFPSSPTAFIPAGKPLPAEEGGFDSLN